MRNAIPSSYLLFSFIYLFQHFQALLQPLVFLNINKYCNPAPPLGQHHRAAGFMDPLYESSHTGPKLGQWPDIFIYANTGHGKLSLGTTERTI